MPKAAVLSAIGEPLTIEDLDLDAPHEGEVKVRLAASGVCHSDLSVQNATLPIPPPVVLGHEGAGVIEEVGAGVNDLKPGDHVVVSWVPQCGQCFFCRRGQAELCEVGLTAMVTGGLLDGSMRFHRHDGTGIGQMAASGTFSEAAIIPAISAVKIDPDIPLKSAALIGCGVLTGFGAANNTAEIREGDTVAVVGCGGVGLNVIQGARYAGAERIVAIDMLPFKLDLAKQFGATDFVDASATDSSAAVMELTEQRGADVAFEVIGRQETIDQTIAMTRRGGQAVFVGVPPMDVMVSVQGSINFIIAEKTLKGCWYGSSQVQVDVPKLTRLYSEGSLLLDELISREIVLDDINDAFRALEAGEVARSVIVY